MYVNVRILLDGISVKYFDINTVSYYRENMKEFNANCINFDRLHSNYEQKISYDSLNLKHKYHKKQIVLDFSNELRRKLGIYVIELISSGITNIKLIERSSSN